MEPTHSEPICIAHAATESYTEQCSLDDTTGEWQDLEQYWGEEKHRLQDFDGQIKPLSSSLEDHLLHDDFLNEPTTKHEEELYTKSECTKIVKGEDTKDIPTTYVAAGFKPQELVAIGTYVDKSIIQGFRYKVRKNLSTEYVFGAKALHLENIGQGYGKRLTFEGETLNENNNYFWSDSHLNGYGFTLQVLGENEVFNIINAKTNQEIGRIVVNNPSLSDDSEISTTVHEKGNVQKEVQIHFSCDVILKDSLTGQNIFIEDIDTRGTAVVTRNGIFTKAKVQAIAVYDFIYDNCYLVPEE